VFRFQGAYVSPPAQPTLDEGLDTLAYGFSLGKQRDRGTSPDYEPRCAVRAQALVNVAAITPPIGARQKSLSGPEYQDAARFLKSDRKDFPVVCDVAGVMREWCAAGPNESAWAARIRSVSRSLESSVGRL
jgi:hypothetical protein